MKIALDKDAYIIEKAHDTDGGFDIRTPKSFFIAPRGSVFINTGIHVEIPRGYGGLIVSKSGLNVKKDITSTGLIDVGYTGSIGIKLYNHGTDAWYFDKGDKISQLAIVKLADISNSDIEIVDSVEEFGASDRGNGGFGSTGR